MAPSWPRVLKAKAVLYAWMWCGCRRVTINRSVKSFQQENRFRLKDVQQT